MAFVHIIFEKYLVPWFPSYFGRLKKCKKIRKTPSQPKLNSTSTLHNLSWVRHKNDFANHPTITSPHTNSMSAISQLLLTRFWWNFKLSGWHLSTQHLSLQHLSISGIHQLLLTRFLWNFKCKFTGPTLQMPSWWHMLKIVSGTYL